MAAKDSKRSPSVAQGSRRRAQVSTQPAVKAKRPVAKPASVIDRREQIIARYRERRRFYRFREIKGKPVNFIEVHTAGDYHAIDIRFQDKTTLHFVIEPGFTVYTEYCDWESSNLRSIKTWPFIRSQGRRG